MKTHHEADVERMVKAALASEMINDSRSIPEMQDPGKSMDSNGPANAPPKPTDAAQVHQPIAIKTILVPTDFSPLAARAVTYARRFAEHFGAQLILLHVTDPVTAPAYCPVDAVEELRAARRKRAEDSLAQLLADSEPPRAKVVPWRAIVTEGDSASETDRVAREYAVDLIVIASHGFSGLTHLLLGSTTERVMRHAPCPVLVVREKQRDIVSTTMAEAHGAA